jgi:hypothetical protein
MAFEELNGIKAEILTWIKNFNWLFQKLNVYKLVNITPKQLLYTTLSFALALYGYQII